MKSAGPPLFIGAHPLRRMAAVEAFIKKVGVITYGGGGNRMMGSLHGTKQEPSTPFPASSSFVHGNGTHVL